MKIRVEFLVLVAAAAAGLRPPPAGATDTLVVSPLAERAPVNPPAPARPARAPAGGDAWIAARVEEAFVSHRSAAAADANVRVADGVVLLGGTTVSESQKAAATAYAREIAGVKSVKNRMRVAGTSVAVGSAALERMDDAAITVRVKAALLRRRAGAFATRVRTRNGVVVLNGRVRSPGEKERIGAIAESLDGIAAVENRLTVRP